MVVTNNPEFILADHMEEFKNLIIPVTFPVVSNIPAQG